MSILIVSKKSMMAVVLTMLLVGSLNAEYSGLPEGQAYATARQDAQTDARFNTNEFQWLACGFFGSFLGVGAAFIMDSKPPQERLLGKSSEYINIYTMYYGKTVRSARLKYSFIGCTISSLIATGIGCFLAYNECVESDPCSPFLTF